jgi:hypothetical protein
VVEAVSAAEASFQVAFQVEGLRREDEGESAVVPWYPEGSTMYKTVDGLSTYRCQWINTATSDTNDDTTTIAAGHDVCLYLLPRHRSVARLALHLAWPPLLFSHVVQLQCQQRHEGQLVKQSGACKCFTSWEYRTAASVERLTRPTI